MPKFKKNTSNAMGKSPFSLKSGNSPLYVDLGQYGSTSPIQDNVVTRFMARISKANKKLHAFVEKHVIKKKKKKKVVIKKKEEND